MLRRRRQRPEQPGGALGATGDAGKKPRNRQPERDGDDRDDGTKSVHKGRTTPGPGSCQQAKKDFSGINTGNIPGKKREYNGKKAGELPVYPTTRRHTCQHLTEKSEPFFAHGAAKPLRGICPQKRTPLAEQQREKPSRVHPTWHAARALTDELCRALTDRRATCKLAGGGWRPGTGAKIGCDARGRQTPARQRSPERSRLCRPRPGRRSTAG